MKNSHIQPLFFRVASLILFLYKRMPCKFKFYIKTEAKIKHKSLRWFSLFKIESIYKVLKSYRKLLLQNKPRKPIEIFGCSEYCIYRKRKKFSKIKENIPQEYNMKHVAFTRNYVPIQYTIYINGYQNLRITFSLLILIYFLSFRDENLKHTWRALTFAEQGNEIPTLSAHFRVQLNP